MSHKIFDKVRVFIEKLISFTTGSGQAGVAARLPARNRYGNVHPRLIGSVRWYDFPRGSKVSILIIITKTTSYSSDLT